jgi:ADP-ribosylglycohydrolase
LATVKASLQATVGLSSGVHSAGNGAAMRAGVIGAFFRDDPERRGEFGMALAQVTHIDPRAVEAAVFVAEVAARCASAPVGELSAVAIRDAVGAVGHAELRERLVRAITLATSAAGLDDVAGELGTSGYALHSVPFALFCLMRYGSDPMETIKSAIRAGGDTDSNAAIVGGWVGALHGEAALPVPLLDHIHDGPFGPTHLRSLAYALMAAADRGKVALPRYSAAAAMSRNVALYPVVVYHGFRRLLP